MAWRNNGLILVAAVASDRGLDAFIAGAGIFVPGRPRATSVAETMRIACDAVCVRRDGRFHPHGEGVILEDHAIRRGTQPLNRRRGSTPCALLVATMIAAVVGAASGRLAAHETDQYTVPTGQRFADLDGYLSAYFRDALTQALKKINSPLLGQHLLFPFGESDRVAWHVLWQFPPDLVFVERFEGQLRSKKVAEQYPGALVLFRPERWIYHHWALMIDPTKLVRLTRCSTLMADGTYFGSDKVAHFVHLGYLYFRAYRDAKTWGADDESAVRRAIRVGTGGNPFTSERTFFGLMATGVLSNADLAVNYVGFKFFRNLTEPVMLGGEMHPSLLVQEGGKWRLSDHVRGDDRFFAAYISDHWDEALNPSDYLSTTATFVRSEVRDRCDSVVAWYRNLRKDLQTRDDFARLAAELADYYGEAYGYSLRDQDAITIADLCFEGLATDAPVDSAAKE